MFGSLLGFSSDNYNGATDTIWSSWSDSDLRSWLVSHGYIKTETQMRRDQLVKLINSKYNEANTRTQTYLTWPDARLRAFLRNHGLPEDQLPTTRPGLLRMYFLRILVQSACFLIASFYRGMSYSICPDFEPHRTNLCQAPRARRIGCELSRGDAWTDLGAVVRGRE